MTHSSLTKTILLVDFSGEACPEVADQLQITLRGVDQLVAQGKLPKRKISPRIVRFSQVDMPLNPNGVDLVSLGQCE